MIFVFLCLTSLSTITSRSTHACVLSCFSHVQLFVAIWTVACKAPLSKGISRQEYWIGWCFPPPGDLPDPRIEPASLTSPALAGSFFSTSTTGEAHKYLCNVNYSANT